ncbi:hypothetical protein CLOACE_13920 [Clostridium acetireducens DSM 10703]|uniref:Uncharacterized protein n=1 Tax=Clostridium acetireducens DSM 10703 TaxID=1121290 RepID=A0A1E8EYE4_9CLOT|nr:hypothetical protein [Clostridium acetireducens]OFI06011.1 hypothetical protein CLOACE_13920 [Clostridium acetireducens DSM 10703]
MPAISKIRFTNVIYENGSKRYNDDIFQFDGHNGVILIENGGGKTVFVQTAIQSILPHSDLAQRKIKNTLMLENNVAHIAIEWILSEKPRRYALTCVTLFMNKGFVKSLKYVYEYEEGDDNSIDKIPFVKETINGGKRAATKEEMGEYYSIMSKNRITANIFNTIHEYHEYIESNFKIIPSEWRKIVLINGAEGGVEEFFDACTTTGQLVDNLLIPTVEEALVGNGTKDFVETFEKQREHFKKYKQLKSKIEESKLVKNEIDSYVKVYKNYDDVNENLIKIKGKIKVIYKLVKNQQYVNIEKIKENKKEQEILLDSEKYLNQKKGSYNLELLKEEKLKAKKSFSESLTKYEEIRNSKEEKEKKRKNLQIAKYNQNIRIQEEKIEFLKGEIEKLDKDENVIDISEKLEVNSKDLRGYYLAEEEKLENEKSIIQSQLDNIENDIKTYKSKILKIKHIEKDLIAKKGAIEKSIELLTKDINKIKNSILDNPSKEKIEEQFLKWNDRIVQLENLIFKYKEQKRSLEHEKQNLLEEIPLNRKELGNLKEEKIKLREGLKNIDENHNELLMKIKEFKNRFYSFNSLYLKRNAILNQLENSMEILREEKENLIFKERIAYRWIDDYKESEIYMADPLIEKWINLWRNSFNYIESGTEYIQGLASSSKDLTEINNKYPLWSISIITLDSEIGKLKDKLKNKLDEISHPIIIISEAQARAKLQGNAVFEEENILMPSIWEKNISLSNFKTWKEEILIKAEEITKYRMDKEKEFSNCVELLKNLREFYSRCSYNEYQDKQRYIRELEAKIEVLANNINNKESRIKYIDCEIEKIIKIISDGIQEQNILQQKIIKSNEYLNKKKEKSENEIKKIKVESKLMYNDEELVKWEREINISIRTKEDINYKASEIKESLSILKSNELYKEVIKCSPKYTEISIEVLKQQRKTLKDILDKKQKGREQLEEEIKYVLKAKEFSEKELNDLVEELEFDLDENLKFPIYGDNEISKLIQESKELTKPLENLEKKCEKFKALFYEKKAVHEAEERKFYNKYKETVVFGLPLKQIKNSLNNEEVNIEKNKNYLANQNKFLEKEQRDIDKNIDKLEKYNFKYLYLAEEIKEIDLKDDFKIEFPYKRTETINDIIDEVKDANELLEVQESKLERSKNEFIRFCNYEILDIKLKEIVVTGVQQKKTFADILEWQSKLNERILRTIEIAENDICEHDKEVQQFITNLHSYLVTMMQELKQIPRKTKIKLGKQWKEVFLFNIPQWDEKEGKEELSKYIEWMQTQLEGERFKDENGIEVEKEVRNAIEKWLQSKQLLKVVMKSNDIKVKCRKVTNDQNMSSMPFSWEVSNSWSGGEKWSKNMTLFLGILNYLTEKRTQVISNRKINRTVIVDNPFGKASSDHVLDPVFFIAKQLGFQIIALTAHAEGKFIRTYFPIVYSCKLRNAINGNNQIMIKNKELRKAFFRDNDAEALFRLGGLEQVKLF